MKIAMIGQKVVPSRLGGVEVVVGELATELVKTGNSVTLFNRKDKSAGKPLEEYNGAKIKEIFTVKQGTLNAIVYTFFATLKAKRMAKKGLFDVLHFHAEGPCAFLNFLPKRSKRNYKIVVTVHGLDWQRSKWGGFATKFLKYCEKKLVKYADEIIVLSENNKNYFMQKYQRETVFIPNGTAKVELKEANVITEKWGLTKDSYILFLARIVHEKGLPYLIPAFKKAVKRTGTDKKLIIAGGRMCSKKYYDYLRDMAKDTPSIIFTGFVEGDELKELFSNAYLYVLPSDIEGMPMSLLEAISYKNTCLVSDIPENVSVIDENSYTFKKADIDDLADKLVELINANLPTHQSGQSRPTWEEISARTEEIYKR